VSSPHRLLVVEDDPEIQYLLAALLEDDDREVVAVTTGAEAERVLESGDVDLVVLDLILPDVDGRQVLTRIRERPETATVPVVVISARGGAEIRQDTYALGADFFVEKPFDPDEIIADIATRLERSADRGRAALRDPLTKLLNRAGLVERYTSREEERSLALVQLDGFATLSERWGWETAEAALVEVAEVLRTHVGEDADSGRLGGGELVVIGRASQVGRTTSEAERVLEAVRERAHRAPDGETFHLTASIGVVTVSANATFEEAIAEARRRLFRAREAGRNRVVSEDEDTDLANARVLVAEDDEISATILLHRLEKEGLDVVRFDNGRAAYEGALEETPDLVILDVKMPGMDGFEVLERLRRIPSYGGVPVILLTSMGSEADVVRGFQLGADDYVLKPFSPIELSARVWRLLRRGRSASAV
jgi:two-component system, cell cycle response regulator